MRGCLVLLRLLLDKFKTHSLRRGGATALLQETNEVDSCVLVGRWQDLKSARVYLRLGQALLTQLLAALSEEQQALIAALVAESVRAFG